MSEIDVNAVRLQYLFKFVDESLPGSFNAQHVKNLRDVIGDCLL